DPKTPFPKHMLTTYGRRTARNGGSAECRSPKYAMLNSSAQGSSVPAVSPSGRGSAWLERLVRDQEVGGSNPLAPTKSSLRFASAFVVSPHQMYGSMNGTTARIRFSSPLLNSNASRCPYFSVASSLRSLADVGIELRHRLRVEMCKFPLVRAYSRREIGSANASRPQLVYLL